MARIAIPIWLLTASLAWAQETTVRLTILGRGGGEEVEIGPEGGLVPYRLSVETDPLGTPGNLGIWGVFITIDTDFGVQQEPTDLDPSFVSLFNFVGRSVIFGRISKGRAINLDDIQGIGGAYDCTGRGRCVPPELGLGQSGAQPVARGHLAVPPAPIGSQFTAEIVVEPLSSHERSFVSIIRSIGSQGPAIALASTSRPDRVVGNALTVRVVANPSSPGDFDRDGDVDLADFLRIVECLADPAQALTEQCLVADLDWDGDVDLADVIAFQGEFTGSL